MAPIARMTRASMLGALGSDFVRTARASGLAPSTVLVTYALRNALLPVVTLLGMVFSFLLGANVLVEKVFAWPGIGSYALEALIASDYAPVQGFVLMMATLYVFLNLAIDVLHGVLDLLGELSRATRMATILITHDLALVAERCDRIVVMHAGHVVESAPTAELFAHPRHPYTARLIASTPRAGAKLADLVPIPGGVPDLRETLPPWRYRARCDRAMPVCDVRHCHARNSRPGIASPAGDHYETGRGLDGPLPCLPQETARLRRGSAR
jgi:oligopeptide/dipeptide ABC transporter ATP-binding protein